MSNGFRKHGAGQHGEVYAGVPSTRQGRKQDESDDLSLTELRRLEREAEDKSSQSDRKTEPSSK